MTYASLCEMNAEMSCEMDLAEYSKECEMDLAECSKACAMYRMEMILSSSKPRARALATDSEKMHEIRFLKVCLKAYLTEQTETTLDPSKVRARVPVTGFERMHETGLLKVCPRACPMESARKMSRIYAIQDAKNHMLRSKSSMSRE